MPVASIPGMIGKLAFVASPALRWYSDRFSPNASTLIRTQPGSGSGTGTREISNDSGGPGSCNTTARISATAPFCGTPKTSAASNRFPVVGAPA